MSEHTSSKKQKMSIASNTLYTMGGMILMNGVLQLLIYPLLNRQMGEAALGDLLYIMGLVAIVCPSIGQALNNSRLVVRRDHPVTNGDYNILLLVTGLIATVIAMIIGRESMTSLWIIIGVLILFMVTIFRYYGDVEYRLNLNYRRFFIYYVCISVGYLAGFGVFKLTGNWLFIFVIGEVAAIAYLAITGQVFKQFFIKSPAFSTATRRGLYLILSYFVTNTTLNMDRMILKPVLGNEAVTWYYVVSLVGKTMVLLVAPVNTIVISYLTKREKLLSKTQFLKMAGIGGVVSLLFFIASQIGTPLFVYLFYRNLYDTVKPLMTLANLAQVLGLYSAYLFILILTFVKEKWQLGLQALHFVVLTAAAFVCTKVWGIVGFSWALLGANVLRVAEVIILGFIKAENRRD